MSAPTTVRPPQPFQLPDRRMVRRPTQPANTSPWHITANPFGVAGVYTAGPEQAKR